MQQYGNITYYRRFFYEKKVIAILFGGASSEHEVSRRSATSIIENIAKEKYEIVLIGITKKANGFNMLVTSLKSLMENGKTIQKTRKKRLFLPTLQLAALL